MRRLLKYLGGGGWGLRGLYTVISYVNLINFPKGIRACHKSLKNKKVQSVKVEMLTESILMISRVLFRG